MSTKRLGEALTALKEKAHEIGHGGTWSLALAAEEELGIIRLAAKVLTECDMDLFPRGTLTPEDAQGAMDVLLAIAKEGA